MPNYMNSVLSLTYVRPCKISDPVNKYKQLQKVTKLGAESNPHL